MKLPRSVFELWRITGHSLDYAIDSVRVVCQVNGWLRAEATNRVSRITAWFTRPNATDCGNCDNVLIPVELCEQIVSVPSDWNAEPLVELDVVDDRVNAHTQGIRGAISVAADRLPGLFPDLAKGWPDIHGALSVTVDIHDLILFLVTVGRIVGTDGGRKPVTLTIDNTTKKLLLTAIHEDCHVAGVLCDYGDHENTPTGHMQFDPKTMYGEGSLAHDHQPKETKNES